MTEEEKRQRLQKRRAEFRRVHRDELNKKARIHYRKNRERIKETARQYYAENKDKINARDCREYYKKYNKKRLAKPQSKLNIRFSTLVWKALKKNKSHRKWERLIGYNSSDLKKHLESLFRFGMSWNNYGRDGWEIDHIIPVSWWKFNNPEDREFKQCWALANLQPLWVGENRAKKNYHPQLKV